MHINLHIKMSLLIPSYLEKLNDRIDLRFNLSLLGSVTGMTSIWMLVFISYDRYNVIVHGVGGKPLTWGKAWAFAIICWVYGTGWAVPPLFGWGAYIPEGWISATQFNFDINFLY